MNKWRKTYVVRYLTNESIKWLEQIGYIVYSSSILNLVYVQTSVSVEEIKKLSGVEQVNECETGRLFGGISYVSYSN